LNRVWVSAISHRKALQTTSRMYSVRYSVYAVRNAIHTSPTKETTYARPYCVNRNRFSAPMSKPPETPGAACASAMVSVVSLWPNPNARRALL
jgi:hypothetical protein